MAYFLGRDVNVYICTEAANGTNAGEVFTLRNAGFTGHTTSLNADGAQEETLEFMSTTSPFIHVPNGANSFHTTLTPTEEM